MRRPARRSPLAQHPPPTTTKTKTKTKQPENLPVVAKFVPGKKLSAKEAEAIAPIGNSPTFLTWEQMQKVVPLWYNLSVTIFDDDEANPVSVELSCFFLFVCS